MPVIAVDKPLRDKLGDDGVTSLVNLINQALGEQKNDIIQLVEETFERRLSEELAKLRIEMAEMKAELRNDMTEMKGELRNDMQVTKTEMIRRMFIFRVGQIAVLVGLLLAFLR